MTQAGDYVLAIASIMLSRLRQDEVTLMLSQVSFNLIQKSGRKNWKITQLNQDSTKFFFYVNGEDQ